MTSTIPKQSKLDELAAMKAARAAKLNQPVKVATPPVLTINVNLVDLEGEERSCALAVRIFNRDEMLDVYRLAALHAAMDFDALPLFAQEVCVARSMVETMWKQNEVPEWLKLAMAENEDVCLQLGHAIKNHRTAYFRGDYRQGPEGKKAPGLAIVPVRPAAPEEK